MNKEVIFKSEIYIYVHVYGSMCDSEVEMVAHMFFKCA